VVRVSTLSGDELIEVLLAGDLDPDEEGEAANDLLSRVLGGYPAHNLSRLIHSNSSRAVNSGAFVVSELGAQAGQVIDEVDFLLSHPSRNARFDALDAALASASAEDGSVLAKAVMLIVDPDQAVRKKALKFLADATPDQLLAAVPYLPDRYAADLVTWLATTGSDPAHLPGILNRLHDREKETRMFAAAAAGRIGNVTRQGIEQAAASDDQDIRSFAANLIQRLDLEQEIRARQELHGRARPR
jgi:hypothetical protein